MAVTANQVVKKRLTHGASYPVYELTSIYGSTLVFVNATGYAVGTTGSGVNKFAGLSTNEQDNSAGASGDKWVEVETDIGVILTGAGTYTQADVKKPVYATDNFTITLDPTAAGAKRIGWVEEYVSATKLMVRLVADDLEALKFDQGQVADATITVSAEGATQANQRDITIQLKDEHGNDVARKTPIFACLLLDANGDAFAATGGTTGIAIGTDGALLALVAKKAWILWCEADGDIDLTWVDTGTEAAYLCLMLPNGKRVISAALTNA